MRRLFNLLIVLFVSLLLAHCGGGGGSGEIDLTAVASVRVTPASATIGVGQTAQLTAQALNADGIVLTGKTFRFRSSNVGIATVAVVDANPATVTAVAAGSATITATSEGKEGPATVNVQAVADTQVSGRVIDGETRGGIAAAVDYEELGGRRLGGNVTAADGSFSFAAPPDVQFVFLRASKAGYVATTLVQSLDRAGTQLETIVLVRETATPGAITGTVRDATNGNGINGARVELARGQGFLSAGGVVANTSTDAAGTYSFAGLAAGTYTVAASKAGFRQGARTAITVSTTSVERQDVVLSPEGAAANVRIVLTWGSTPADLDAHLTGPNPSDASRFHVFFANRLSAGATPFAGLDVDRRDGNGPETITITKFNPGGFYRYSVHDYTNGAKPGLTELGRSGAKVEVYTGAGLRTFFVPNEAGNLWTVFELSGDIANPTFTERNAMGAAPLDEATIP